MSGGIEVVTTFTGAAIQAAIDKIYTDTGGGGGVIMLPPGNYLVSSTINMKSKITLQGAGKQTTRLLAQGDITVLNISGIASANTSGGAGNHIASPFLYDLAIDGGNNAAWSTQPMVTMYYCHTAEIKNVNFDNKYGIGVLVGAETWDCDWRECRFSGSGGVNQALPSMVMQSANGATFPAFGSSTDATNDQRFYHCTWEGFRDGALWVLSPTGANAVSNIYFFGCKADQNASCLGDWFRFENCGGVYIEDLDLATTTSGSAYAGTPFAMFTFKSCKNINLRDWNAYVNSGETDCLIHFDGVGYSGIGNKFVTIDAIEVIQIGSGSRSFATGMIRYTGTNLNTNFDFISYPKYSTSSPLAIKTIFNLTAGTVTYGLQQAYKPISSRAGAYSDAVAIGTQEPGVPTGVATIAGIDITNHRLYVRYSDGTYKYATLT